MNFKKAASSLLAITMLMAQFSTVYADIYSSNGISDKVKEKIEKIVNAPSHLAGIDKFKRKCKKERIQDNIDWYKKYGQINKHYNKYGLDIKDYRDAKDFMTGKELRRLAIHHGDVNPKDYKDLIRDKILFEKVVREHYPEIMPATYFKFRSKDIIPTDGVLINEFKDTKSALDSLKDGKYFIKEVAGSCGDNAILLTKKSEKLSFRHVTKGYISLEDVWNITNKTDFMVQEYIENHSDIKKLSPYALSTIRIVTTRFHDNVHILSADMRVSCQENAVVDNFHKHGAIVHVGTKTGKLAKYAHRRLEGSLKVHPISKIKFENYKLPYWQETLETVKKLHNIFPQFSSLGWDIAITPTGPKIIESNYGWDIAVPQVTTGGIRPKWEKLKNI